VKATWDDRRDRELFNRVAEGDREALAELYDGHSERLYRHALSLARRPEDAEDLVQIVFVKLASTNAHLVVVKHPGRYLHSMVRTAAIDLCRRRLVRAEQPIDDQRALPGHVSSPCSEGPTLERALDLLPCEQREVVSLHLVEGFSFREIGGVTGVSTFTAASRYRLGLNRLRQLVGVGDADVRQH
jgi:RNA polymerase sigma-70 factor (ECF subfamily)